MIKVKEQLPAGEYTVLLFDNIDKSKINGTLYVDGICYKTEIVYDLSNAIGILGHGNFVGKEIAFD